MKKAAVPAGSGELPETRLILVVTVMVFATKYSCSAENVLPPLLAVTRLPVVHFGPYSDNEAKSTHGLYEIFCLE
jgi:hypothetical protein